MSSTRSALSTAIENGLELSPYPLRKFTVAEYRRLGSIGVLTESDRVELLEGWIVPKMNHSPIHDGTIDLVEDALRIRLPEDWRLRIQSVITTHDSEPEPDLAIVRGPAGRYLQAHPTAADIALVIEVAETSLACDRLKCRLYAREGIVCYWIVNLIDRRLEVFTDPTGNDPNPAYRRRQDFAKSDSVPLVVDGREIATLPVSQFLPA